MTKQFTFELQDRPGALAEIAKAFADAGVNIDGGLGLTQSDKGVISVILSDEKAGAAALSKAGIDYSEREVLMTNLQNRPGAMAELTQLFADENINLDHFYITMDGKQVFGSSDLDGAKNIASKLGIL